MGGLGMSLVTSVYMEALVNLAKELRYAGVANVAAIDHYNQRVHEIVDFWHSGWSKPQK
jgi:hypothetical protein